MVINWDEFFFLAKMRRKPPEVSATVTKSSFRRYIVCADDRWNVDGFAN